MINKKRDIFFSENDLFSKISEILEKNGVNDNPVNDNPEVATDSDEPVVIIASRLIRKIVRENVTEKEFLDSLQKELKTDAKTAENIFKVIKEEILPFAENIVAESIPNMLEPIQTAITSNNKSQNDLLPEQSAKLDYAPQPLPKKIKKSTPIPIVKESVAQIKQSKGPDNYREPIE